MRRYLLGHRQSYGTPQLSDEWGEFDYYIEIEEQFAVRQVNVFENGEMLRYSREHWCDGYGMMFIGKYSLKEKANRGCQVINPRAFELVWKRSLDSTNWERQKNTARMSIWGSWSERIGSDH